MAGVTPLQIHMDHTKTRQYRSKNSNDLRQTWTQDYSTDGCQVDWLFSLRRPEKNEKPGQATLRKSKFAASVPSFHDVRQKNYATTDEHQEGPYQTIYKRDPETKEMVPAPEEEQTNEKYYNYNDTRHILDNRVSMRVSSGNTENVGWTLNLRGGLQNKPDKQWKRYFTKPHKSFDMAKETLKSDEYRDMNTSVRLAANQKFERNQNALPIETIRDQPIVFYRWPGCEGTALNTWHDLANDKKHGHKSRMNIKWETTLREKEGYLENLGSRLTDNRSEGCVTEMLGKKRWHFASNPEVNPRGCDAKFDSKLYHLNNFDFMPEADEETLEKRRHKQPRKWTNTERESK